MCTSGPSGTPSTSRAPVALTSASINYVVILNQGLLYGTCMSHTGTAMIFKIWYILLKLEQNDSNNMYVAGCNKEVYVTAMVHVLSSICTRLLPTTYMLQIC